jgi:hypothetical protein
LIVCSQDDMQVPRDNLEIELSVPLIRRFEGSWQRVERADAQNDTLAQAWNRLCQDDLYSVSAHIDHSGSGRIEVNPRHFPEQFSLYLGEILYQFRAALDGCVYRAAILETGQDPPPNEQLLAFPICYTDKDFRKSARNVAPLSQNLRAIIESVQPYKTPKLEPSLMVLNFNRALGILNDWARKDRHRQLHLMASWASNIQPRLNLPPGVTLASMDVIRDGILKYQSEIAMFQLTGFTRNMTIKVNPDLMLDIMVDEPPLPCADNDTLGNRLATISHAVKTIIQAFEMSCERMRGGPPL